MFLGKHALYLGLLGGIYILTGTGMVIDENDLLGIKHPSRLQFSKGLDDKRCHPFLRENQVHGYVDELTGTHFFLAAMGGQDFLG
jgi:hypothetical protein